MGIKDPRHFGFLGVRHGVSKPALTGSKAVFKCPKEGCWKPDGHAPKTHSTQAQLRLQQMQVRQPVRLGRMIRRTSPKASPANRQGGRLSVGIRQLSRMKPEEVAALPKTLKTARQNAINSYAARYKVQ